ncbi:peptidoglycan DD-metalloendopeptidase family protein [Flavobacterium sp. UBA6135]|uniref:peptidoglycan DD-metalloendopeptidase family protein n=1 Tax=Flavobacterium sp. UBA6135 TaxID=1946553 RepID=UPI0025BC661F|nr:peptidoglycan DD-metalloendopeptidase family protein [Flavobacterium sp. UBA6135]
MQNLISLFETIESVQVIDSSISYTDYLPIDLSINSALLANGKPENASDYELLINNYLQQNKAKVAFGGYCEHRDLYQRSTVFKNTTTDERNIHIGLDLWIAAGTSVLAALDGKVHSFQYNSNFGDYGPTIILEHEINNQKFYTLYGHLSLESLENLRINQEFKKGTIIATLGDATVNGDYAPHLHFQIIKDIQNYKGDYPGVCSSNDLSFYKENCPDPNLLLKIKKY